ncbi:MAG TPA: hypothetical protein ENJ00_05035 [Phycisphaerales bacterium]|nr:hypothetical protein [Phycisphaerales bacterium]
MGNGFPFSDDAQPPGLYALATMPRLPFIVLGLIAASSLVGCSSYAPPQLALTSARIAEESPEGVVIDLSIDVSNPNEQDMPLERVTYRLTLDGRPAFSGTRSAEATVRRLGTQTIVLPAAIDLEQFPLPEGQAEFVLTGTLVYVTPGELAQILFDAGVRRPSVRFSHRGVINLARPQTDTTP